MSEPKLTLETNDDPAWSARIHAQHERGRRNGEWLAAHWADLLPGACGRFVAVAGQEAFVADTAAEAWEWAKSTHPEDDGAIVQYVRRDTTPRLYANYGRVVSV